MTILAIDPERLKDTLERSAQIGPGLAGGLSRLTLTAADKAMRDTFVQWARDDGFDVEVDAAGNIWVTLDGQDAGPPVVMGSHLDTQVTGGRFDGILGVLAGLEALRAVKASGIVPRRPMAVVNFTNEEGARFAPPMMASAVFAGVKDLEWLYARKDDAGETFGAALAEIGYRGSADVSRVIDAYFELHIEQGPELHEEGVALGVVTGGYATHGMRIVLTGETAHTGPTPMARRRNALVGAAMIAAAVNDIGWAHAPVGKATASRLTAWPNKPGILSSHAEVVVDVRHADRATAEAMRMAVVDAAGDAAWRANVHADIAETWFFGDETFDVGLNSLVRQAADTLQVSHRDILSQAGHDAYYVSRVAPAAILFSPCIDGITHNEAEDVPMDATVACAEVLAHAAFARANRT